MALWARRCVIRYSLNRNTRVNILWIYWTVVLSTHKMLRSPYVSAMPADVRKAEPLPAPPLLGSPHWRTQESRDSASTSWQTACLVPGARMSTAHWGMSTMALASNLGRSRVPLGSTAKTGETCPETRVWQVVGTPTTTAPIAKGNRMPPYGSRAVTWKLTKYA